MIKIFGITLMSPSALSMYRERCYSKGMIAGVNMAMDRVEKAIEAGSSDFGKLKTELGYQVRIHPETEPMERIARSLELLKTKPEVQKVSLSQGNTESIERTVKDLLIYSAQSRPLPGYLSAGIVKGLRSARVLHGAARSFEDLQDRYTRDDLRKALKDFEIASDIHGIQ